LNSAHRKRSQKPCLPQRVLDLPFVITVADENKVVAVQADAKERIKRLAVLLAKVEESLLDLLDDLSCAG